MEQQKEDIERGIVNAYDTFKGIGFIRREKGKDVFFFYDDVLDDKSICIGDTVSFNMRKMPKGPRAYNVKVLRDL